MERSNWKPVRSVREITLLSGFQDLLEHVGILAGGRHVGSLQVRQYTRGACRKQAGGSGACGEQGMWGAGGECAGGRGAGGEHAQR